MAGIKTLKIFLASSSELKEDREQFEIFINRKNKEYIKQYIFLELVIWEDFLDAMSQTRLQDEYNKVITECDVVVSLFKTKVGKYTEEEFDTAFGTFKENNKPLIYTYFKDSQINLSQITPEINTLLNFKDKLGRHGHFYTTYNSVDDLKFQFDQQINKFLPNLKDSLPEISLKSGKREDLRKQLEDRELSPNQQLEEVQTNRHQLEQSFQSQINQLQEQLETKQSQISNLTEKLQSTKQELSNKELIVNQLQQQINDLKNISNLPKSTEIELKSSKGVDYTKLRDLLAAGKWKEADQETPKVMLQQLTASNRHT